MRTALQVTESPIAGDVIDVTELTFDGDEDSGEYNAMLRVIAVAEDHVWYKEYGPVGRQVCHVKRWTERLKAAKKVTLVRHGDSEDAIRERNKDHLTLNHFAVAATLGDQARQLKILRWACDVGATVQEMTAWSRAENGESLVDP